MAYNRIAQRTLDENLEQLNKFSDLLPNFFLDSCASAPSSSIMSVTNGMNGKDTEAGLPYTEPTTPPRSEKRLLHPHTVRTEATAFIGEFIGTFMFLSLAFCGTQIALNGASLPQLTSDENLPDVNKLLYIAFAFGVSLAINVAIFADVSGAKFNPAVSFRARAVIVLHTTKPPPQSRNPPPTTKAFMWVTRKSSGVRHV
jgi:hypothetical protein